MKVRDMAVETEMPATRYIEYAQARLAELSYRQELIGSKMERLEYMESRKYDIGAPVLTGMPHNPRQSQSAMEDAVCRAIPMKAEVEKAKQIYDRMLGHVFSLMENIEDAKLQSIILQRDLKKLEWKQIAYGFDRSARWCMDKHNTALEELGKQMVSHDTEKVFREIISDFT